MTTDPAAAAVEAVLGALRPEVSVDGRRGSALFHPLDAHRGNPGWLHGGLAATVLDHVCARTAAAALGARVVTGTLDLRYPRPVPIGGGPYLVEATAAEPRGRMVRVEGAILDQGRRALVQARALFVVKPGGAGHDAGR